MLEKYSKTKMMYQGNAVGFRCDEIILPNGKKAAREYLTHPGAVAVVPFLDSPRKKPLAQCRIIMVEQFRYPVGKLTIEIPAGKLSPKENPLKCVERELQEETGYRAKKINRLISFWPTAAFANEIIHIYWADQLTAGPSNPDDDEFLNVHIETFASLLKK